MYINIKNTSLTYSELKEIEGLRILTYDEIMASNTRFRSGTRGGSEFWIPLGVIIAEKVLDETGIFPYFSEKVKGVFTKILNKFWRAKKEEILSLLPEGKEIKITIRQGEETVVFKFVSKSSNYEAELATFIEQLRPYLKEGAVIEIEE